MQTLKTLGDVLKWAEHAFESAKLYYGHGTNNAWDEAVALALFVLQLPPDVDASVIERVLTPKEIETLSELIHQRVTERIPVPYLTHEAWFCGLKFYVDKRVIIPRSPMAELIMQGFQPWFQHETTQPIRILDLCTGSGCIAIACAKYFMGHTPVKVDAIDISKDALEVAKKNIQLLQCVEEVHCFQGDLFQALNTNTAKYDIIISNPPYVDLDEMDALPSEYHFEPRLSLEAGRDGLDIVKRILAESGEFLTEKGLLFVEVGNAMEALEAQFPQVPFTWLEFEQGGHGVFMLDKQTLKRYFN